LEGIMDHVNFFSSFVRSTQISIPEAVMFLCFGLSWPVSVSKALRTKKVSGKSPFFMTLIAFGYLCGVAHKINYSRDLLIVLYLFNLVMILIDLSLYLKYRVGRNHCESQINAAVQTISKTHPKPNNRIRVYNDAEKTSSPSSPHHETGPASQPVCVSAFCRSTEYFK
jgi:hypothetical protein